MATAVEIKAYLMQEQGPLINLAQFSKFSGLVVWGGGGGGGGGRAPPLDPALSLAVQPPHLQHNYTST